MRRRYLSEDEEDGGGTLWVTVFSDMSLLILTFFVMIVSFAVFQKEQLAEAINSLQEAFGILPKWSNLNEIENKSLEEIEFEALIKAAKEIEAIKGVTVTMTIKGLKIELENPVLFDTGEADLKSEAKGILDQISGIFQKYSLKNEMNISGHTDNRPINTLRFPSNWELSTARATNVLKYLIKTGFSPEQMSASGYAEYRPIASNKTKKGRARNRRMEILILRRYRSESKSSSEQAKKVKSPKQK